MSGIDARGVLYVHSAPAALCPHIEWAVGAALGAQEKLEWEPQPAAPGTYRAEINWIAPQGVVLSSPRLFVVGRTYATKLPKKLQKVPTGRAGLTHLSLAFFMP